MFRAGFKQMLKESIVQSELFFLNIAYDYAAVCSITLVYVM